MLNASEKENRKNLLINIATMTTALSVAPVVWSPGWKLGNSEKNLLVTDISKTWAQVILLRK